MFAATEAAVAEQPLPAAPDDTIYHDTADEPGDDDDRIGFPISAQQLAEALDEEIAGYLTALY